MEDQLVIKKIKKALKRLFLKDISLITNDLSEQSITHKLAEYLQRYFLDYNVDCEYNGNIDEDTGKKKIRVIKDQLKQIGLLRKIEASDLEKEFTIRAVFPDIIIHKRLTNKHNLCIIEVKKNTCTISYAYDQIKLKAYTNNLVGNILKYQLGIFIKIIIDKKIPRYEINYYKNGDEIDI